MKVQSFLVAVFIAATSHVSVCQAMQFDPSFAENGKAVNDLTPERGDFVTAIDIQADGKIVAGGYWRQDSYQIQIALVRYLPDGELDTDFGADGRVIDDLTEDTDELHSVAIQNDGGILVGFLGGDGDENSTTLRNLVARYTPGGELDADFGVDGILEVPDAQYSFGELIVQTDGGFFVCGQLVSGGPLAYVAKFNSDGSADTGFGDSGIFSIGLEYDVDQCESVMILSDGSILVGGQTYTDASTNLSKIVVFKLSPSGELNTGFGSDGLFSYDFGKDIRYVDDLVELDDGKLMILSRGYDTPSHLFMLQPDGGLDSGFGDQGVLEISGAVTDLLLLPNGKVMVSGYDIARRAFFQVYNDNGSLEPSFAGNGRQEIGTYPESAAIKMILQDDGKLVVGGRAEVERLHNHAFLTMRFLDPDPDLDGMMDADNCPNEANADQSDSDGDGVGDVCDLSPDPVEEDNSGSGGSSGSDGSSSNSGGGGGGSAGAWFISFLALLVCLRNRHLRFTL